MQFKDEDYEIAVATTTEEIKKLGLLVSLNTMKWKACTSIVNQKDLDPYSNFWNMLITTKTVLVKAIKKETLE